MATNTPVYQLRKPAGTDLVNVTSDISDNMDKIEAALVADDTDIASLQGRVTALEVFLPIHVYKPADEQVVSSVTAQNDDDLKFTAVAGKKYLFELFLSIDGGAARDFQFRFTHPGGTLVYGVHGPSINSIATTGNTATDMNVFSETNTSGTSTLKDLGLSDDLEVMAWVVGSYDCTVGGVLQLQWAQSVSSASQVSIKKGSYLRAVAVS